MVRSKLVWDPSTWETTQAGYFMLSRPKRMIQTPCFLTSNLTTEGSSGGSTPLLDQTGVPLTTPWCQTHWQGELVGCLANSKWLGKALSFPTIHDTPSKARDTEVGCECGWGISLRSLFDPVGLRITSFSEALKQRGWGCQGTIYREIEPQQCPTWEVLTNLIREDHTVKRTEIGKLLHPCTWDSLRQQQTPEILRTWER